MNNLIITYRDRDQKTHDIQLQTALNQEDIPELEKLIGFKRKSHKPIKIYKVAKFEC